MVAIIDLLIYIKSYLRKTNKIKISFLMSPSELRPETQLGLHSKELRICLLCEVFISFLPNPMSFHPMALSQKNKAHSGHFVLSAPCTFLYVALEHLVHNSFLRLPQLCCVSLTDTQILFFTHVYP